MARKPRNAIWVGSLSL